MVISTRFGLGLWRCVMRTMSANLNPDVLEPQVNTYKDNGESLIYVKQQNPFVSV